MSIRSRIKKNSISWHWNDKRDLNVRIFLGRGAEERPPLNPREGNGNTWILLWNPYPSGIPPKPFDSPLSFRLERIQSPWRTLENQPSSQARTSQRGYERDNKVLVRSHSGTRGWFQPWPFTGAFTTCNYPRIDRKSSLVDYIRIFLPSVFTRKK